MNSSIKSFICILLTLSATNTNAALRIHKAPLPEVDVVEKNYDFTPEEDTVTGRGRDQRLSDALTQMTQNKITVKYVDEGVDKIPVSWRSNEEPLQIMLTKLSRNYGVDIVLNKTTETLYVGIDTGQCDPFREAEILKTKRQWDALDIKKMPTLPAFLPVELDIYGYETRLC